MLLLQWTMERVNLSVVYDQGEKMTTISSLTICLKPEDDFPHPRHLCFRYPFGKTSPKRHCKKCYCYVCDELAPCKKWNKPPQRHCHATHNDKKWRIDRQLIRKKFPANTRIMAYHRLFVSFVWPPDNPQAQYGCAGAVIRNGSGDWVLGFAMHIHNNVDTRDESVPPYIALREGLRLAWSRGFRCLEVQLGFLFHDGFWFDFTKDTDQGRKFRLQVDPSSTYNHEVFAMLKDVEEYLNREWFIDVKNCPAFKDEACAFTMATLADCQVQEKQVFDFSTHPDTARIMEIARDIENNKLMNQAYSQVGLARKTKLPS